MQKAFLKARLLLTCLLIVLLPTQLGKHFWPDFSYINNLRVDYLSPTIYVTDIIIFFIFVISAFFDPPAFSFLAKTKQKTRLCVVLILLFLSALWAASPFVSLIKVAKITEFLFVGLYFRRIVEKELKIDCLISLLAIGAFFESILAIWQFVIQGSVGGPLWYFGEREMNASTPFAARAVIGGELFLRPYGTLPHPNVLGGYLAVVLVFVLARILWRKTEKRNTPMNKAVFFDTTMFIVGTTALFLTYSRISWVAFFFAVIVLLINRFGVKEAFFLTAIFLLLIFFLAGGQISSRFLALEDVDKESYRERQELGILGLEMFFKNPIFGVGPNNFLPASLSYQKKTGTVKKYQPAHNIYLLIASETGFFAFFLFIEFIAKTLLRHLRSFGLWAVILLQLIFFGFFDHYLYTLQQGQLLFALVLGLSWSKTKMPKT